MPVSRKSRPVWYVGKAAVKYEVDCWPLVQPVVDEQLHSISSAPGRSGALPAKDRCLPGAFGAATVPSCADVDLGPLRPLEAHCVHHLSPHTLAQKGVSGHRECGACLTSLGDEVECGNAIKKLFLCTF